MDKYLTYPKIENLYVRDPDTHKITSIVRLPEFNIPKTWLVTEKIDGTNIRVIYHGGVVEFRGRTDAARLHATLFQKLQQTFAPIKLRLTFEHGDDSTIILFGEGYGPKIQKGGGNYTPDVSFRLFDVWVDGRWLDWDNVCGIAKSLGIETVPVVERALACLPSSKDDLKALIEHSFVAWEENELAIDAEGIVARTDPLLFMRNGQRLGWKLKFRDW